MSRFSERIIVRLGGRLGNQMFQYAAGRALATRLGLPLELEGLSPESTHKSRVQLLEAFPLDLPLRAIPKGYPPRWLLRLSRLGLPVRMRGQKVFQEKGFGYDPAFEHIDGGRYLIGGWVSHRYFDEIRGRLLEEFRHEPPLSDRARAMQHTIETHRCPIAVHLRRGDYVSNPRNLERFGLCGPDYYRNGIGYMRERLADCHFFVFSDDIAMASRELADITDLTFVAGNTQEEDLYLMTRCRHHLIANSTFSWWAAWLNDHPDRIVIAPLNWFGPALAGRLGTHDLIPAQWQRL